MDVRTPVATNYGNLPTKFAELWKSQVEKLKEKFGPAIERVLMPGADATDLPTIYVQKDRIIEVLGFAKADLGYDFLCDITATDEQPEEFRFEVVYHLKAMTSVARIRFKSRLREGEEIGTLVPVWPGANWAEREVWDMFGIKFSGHPDLRRILMDQRWEGHPLRKDYPLRGYQIFPTPEPVDEKLLGM